MIEQDDFFCEKEQNDYEIVSERKMKKYFFWAKIVMFFIVQILFFTYFFGEEISKKIIIIFCQYPTYILLIELIGLLFLSLFLIMNLIKK